MKGQNSQREQEMWIELVCVGKLSKNYSGEGVEEEGI